MIQMNDDGQMTAITTTNATNAIDDAQSNALEHITPDIVAIDTNESISITKRERSTNDDTSAICYSPSWGVHIESDDRHRQRQQQRQPYKSKPIEREPNPSYDIIECDTLMPSSPPTLPTSLKFNRNTMSISVKRTSIKKADLKRRRLQPPSFNDTIICSPEFGHIDDIDLNDSDANGGHFGRLNENYVNSYHHNDMNVIDDIDNNGEGDADDYVGDASGGGNSAWNRASEQRQRSRLMELIRSKDQLRSAVVLRNPRGNQPRTYTTDALYAALMDVKSGESIYR